MNVRRWRSVLWGVSWACGLGCVAVAWWGWLAPLGVEPAVDAGQAKALSPEASATRLPPLADFEPLSRLQLRRPLYDPAPAGPAIVAAKPPPLAIKLEGTVIEPDNCIALVLLSDGQMEMKKVGESAGGATILSIETDCITVRYCGQDLVLKINRGSN